jgi:hypothetical protein
MVHMLDLMGYDLAMDIDAPIGCARSLPTLIANEIPGQVAKAERPPICIRLRSGLTKSRAVLMPGMKVKRLSAPANRRRIFGFVTP